MKTIHSVHAAKTNLSKLLERAEAGDEVVIARGKTPIVRLTPRARRRLGAGSERCAAAQGSRPRFSSRCRPTSSIAGSDVRLLLDTHALLWWLDGDRRLSKKARTAIADEDNVVVVSAAEKMLGCGFMNP